MSLFGNNDVSPLMAEEQADERPTLGGGTYTTSNIPMSNLDLEEQSPLERLIARSTSDQRGDDFSNIPPEQNPFVAGHHTNTSSNSTPFMISIERGRPSFLTLTAGTLCILQIGFVWSSFLSSSWFDTHLLLSVSLPVVHTDTDQLLHSTSLATLLSDLFSAEEQTAAMFVIITALILPCLFSVSGPVWTMGDRKDQDKVGSSLTLLSLARWRRENGERYPRRFIEYILRISLCVFFFLCILDIGTSSIEMNNSNTRFTVTNQMQGGLASYTLGMTCALIVVMVLRIGETNFHTHCTSLLQDGMRRAPPNQAFQLPWNIMSSSNDHQDADEMHTPLLDNDNNGHQNVISSMQIDTETVDENCLPFWKRVILYELAAMSTLLWLPSLFLPLFELTYAGIISGKCGRLSIFCVSLPHFIYRIIQLTDVGPSYDLIQISWEKYHFQ
jgi:hypothetical protein